MRALRIAIGVALVGAGIALVFMPLRVADWMHRPHETSSQLINLRATWGGTLAGLGAFIAARSALRPWGVTIATLLLTSLAGIGAARAVGFVLDGGPDTLQWAYLGGEIALVAGSAIYLARRRR